MELEKAELEFRENTDANIEENTETYVEFERLLRYSIAMEAYNQSKKDYVLKGSTLEFDDILGLTEYIEENGTLAKLYSDSLTEAGKESVLNGLFGTDAKSKEDLQKTFAKLIILNGIKRNSKSGSDIIAKVLTEENVEAAGMEVPEYLALESTLLADDALYRMRTSLNIDNLESKIEECAKEDETPEKPPKENSSSGGGGISVGTKKEEPKEEQKPVASEEVFTDIEGYAWAKEAIEFLAKNEVINGTGDGRFNPSGKLTREAAAKIICLAMGIDALDTNSVFADVDSGAWYAPYVCELNERGVVNGVDASRFGIGLNITREDFAVIIARAYGISSGDASASFTDADLISGYAKDAVTALSAKGIITGYTDGSFAPKNNITRAEGAQIIFRVLNTRIN